MARKTKIIATLGPASSSAETIKSMVSAGMDVARLNFSHGEQDEHKRLIEHVRAAGEESGKAVAVLQDIQGPRIRVGTFPGGACELLAGTEVTLVPGESEGGDGTVYVQHLDAIDLAPGDKVLMNDGLVTVEVRSVAGDGTVTAEVINGGPLADHKGVACPGAAVDLPAVNEKDVADIAFGREHGVDLIAASFVRNAADVMRIRELAGPVPVIAKIELYRAYENLEEILSAADGAMVARGDLGVEIGFESLPRVQKEILAKTHAAGAISITATEMLESMTTSPRPTRAEVTDVANAVLDGSDAVMLSAESAIGKYPVRTVEVMAAVCIEAERSPGYPPDMTSRFPTVGLSLPTAIARAAADTAQSLGLRTVVAFTETGSTARLVSGFRPDSRIVAFTPKVETYRKLAIVWGVTPLLFPRFDSTDEMIQEAEKRLLDLGLVERGEKVAMLAGIPPNQEASTNLLKLHVIGEAPAGV